MTSLIKMTKRISVRYAHVLLVLLAFTIMVVLSYLFMSRIESRNLRQSARNAILYTEACIKSDMQELETLVGIVSETIRNMIEIGEGSDAVNEYILYINNYIEADQYRRLYGATGIFGVFDVFGGIILIGYDEWIPPDGYFQTDRPWYTGAINAAGDIHVTDPYLNVYSNKNTITLSRQIFDKNGNALGIISVNIEMDRIQQYVVDTQFVEGGYGFLLSKDSMIIAHPETSMVGISFRTVKSGIAALIDEFTQKGSISEVVTDDYRGVQCIVFIQRLQNGWYMGAVTPRDNYFRGTRNLAVTLASFGAICAAFLIWLLLKISAEKTRADERTKIMLNATPLVAYIFDKDFKVIDCNQNAVTLFELSSKKEFCDRFYELLPEYQPDGRLTVDIGMEITRKTLKDGYSRFEWSYKKLNGELIPCEITSTRVMYEKDFNIVGYMRDLREQKKMMEEIQQRARLLDTVNSAAAVLLSNTAGDSFEDSLMKSFALVGSCLDVDRVQIWRNEDIDGEMHFVLRYEWLSEYGKQCSPVPYGLHFPYSSRPEWKDRFLRGENINAPLCELSEDDRSFFAFYEMKSIVVLPMFQDGKFWGFFSIDDCRSERTLTDEEINILSSAGLMMTNAINRNTLAVKTREAEERAQIMIDAAPLCAFFWDKKLSIIDCNQEAVKMFGLSSKQEFIDVFVKLSPERQPDGVPSGEKGGRLVYKALEEGYSRFEWMHQKLNGELIPAEVTCIRVKHKDEYTVTEYIRDLREQKAMIAEMQKAEIAEESNKAKSDFLARMSHDIRTPMNAILGITEIQLQDDTHPPLTKEAFERIYNSGDLLLGIINDILDLSKIEAGKLELVPSQYDIASLIHDTAQLNILRYETKPIEFILEVKEDLPLLLIGDELRIKQILNNLLSNAFKYTEEGTVKLTAYAESISPSKKMLVFIIKDSGQGMTDEQVQKLGDEYARFNLEANRKTEGTGLGMNITRNLTHLMNGSISIESAPGAGSTFTVCIPQDCNSPAVIGKEVADNLMKLNFDNSIKIRASQINREFMPYGRVLVVDDVETNLYVARGLLAPYGLSVETVMSGFEAIDKIKEGATYDIIFMDHMMPRMDGIEATKILRDLGYTNSVVALTANAIAGQAAIFMENGFDDFISKPIDIRQLNMTLNKLIRDKYPAEVIEEARKQKNHLYSGNKQKKELEPELAETFIRDAKKTLTILEAIYVNNFRRDEDLSIFIINAHAMKSALANIGETALSTFAMELEQAGRENNTKFILAEIPSFLEMLRVVITNIEREKDAGKNADYSGDNQYLKAKLLAVKQACALYDKKTAKDALVEIKKEKWPRPVNEQLETITIHLLHSEFDETIQVIDRYVQEL
jgi:signal transduction histidine kinase/DNA-binding response OmpR family regulator